MKWEKLAQFLEEEPLILSGRISPRNLRGCYEKGLALKLEYNEEIIAFQALWPADSDLCLELGSFWIREDWRGLRLGSKIMKETYHLIPEDKNVFVITHNPKVVHLMRKYHWKEASANDWFEVIPYNASCSPCDRVSEEEKSQCYLRATEECRMFFL